MKPTSPTKEIKLNYEPLAAQALFHAAPHKFKLYGGAMAGGKSYAICAEAIQLGLDFPGNCILLGRKTMKDFKKTTMVTFFDILNPELIKYRNKTDGIVELINGTEFIFSDFETTDKLKSLNLGAFAIDEATEVTEEVFLMLMSRLRRNVPGIRYHGLLATNPEPGWVKDRFISQQVPDHIYIPAKPRDNFHLPKGYLEDLVRDFSAVWTSKYIEGSWEDFGNQVFNAKHIIPTDGELPEMGFKVMTVDPAISEKQEADETAISCGGVGFDNLIHEIETIHGHWSFNEQVEQIKSMFKRHKPDLIGIEIVAYQQALYQVLRDEGYPVIPMRADKDKIRRAISVSHLFERGLVRINHAASRKQLIEFPKGTRDDLVDAIVYWLKMLKEYAAERYEKKDDPLKGLDARSQQFWRDHQQEKKSLNGQGGSMSDFYKTIL
jgi:phage terminase large subunit